MIDHLSFSRRINFMDISVIQVLEELSKEGKHEEQNGVGWG